jgi:hypothetical protein
MMIHSKNQPRNSGIQKIIILFFKKNMNYSWAIYHRFGAFIVMLFFATCLFAQAPSLTWEKTLGGTGDDELRSLTPTPDGGFIAAGFTNSTDGDIATLAQHGGYDYFVVKITATGSIEWLKTYGGTGTDKANIAIPTSDNGYIIFG